MLRLIFCVCWLLSYDRINCAEFENINKLNELPLTNENDEELQNALPANYYDEHLLQDIERHLKIINLGQENQRLGCELLSKKIDEIHNRLNELLTTKVETDNKKTQTLKSCDEALKKATAKDGVYQISIPDQSAVEPFYVYCMRHPTTNEAWTVIQRRIRGGISFYRNWHEYKVGFGDLLSEYWLGLDKIHVLTNSKPHKLWIELKDFGDATRTANYEQFFVGDEDSKYALKILGEFSGGAGDSLRYSAGSKFSTKDSKNDFSTGNGCANERVGAWWFGNCAMSHLNGQYFEEFSVEYGKGILWNEWQGGSYSLKYAHMAIRAVD